MFAHSKHDITEDKTCQFEDESRNKIKLATQKLRRTSTVFDEIEKDLGDKPEEDSLKETEQKIKQLETSIVSLDMELERIQIEKMKSRTKKVRERMSLVEAERNS